jgi:hypothetical protein
MAKKIDSSLSSPFFFIIQSHTLYVLSHILVNSPFVISFATATVARNDNTAFTQSVFNAKIGNILKTINPVFV